jgi:acetyltransferase
LASALAAKDESRLTAPFPLPRPRPLDVFFSPNRVALIGASEAPGSVGRTVLENLVRGAAPGTVFAVNPNRSAVLGLRAWPTIGAVPEAVDLAVIVTPARLVPEIVGQCADAGVRGAVIISAGFKEHGASGAALEAEIIARARGRLRIIGPNCLGVMNPRSGLNATFAGAVAQPGRVAFLSQSGAICAAILDWSVKEHVGFSAFVSTGSMLDVGWGDLIDYLGDDPGTDSIVMYMESIGDARSFLSAAREVALTKPLIVIKAGRSAEAARAAASHTGSLTGSDAVLDAAFRRCGVLRVDTIADLFNLAEALAKQPRPKGPNLTILTNAGGPGVLATDALIAGHGRLTELSDQTLRALDEILPPAWSHGNPIDVLGDAGAERFAGALDIAARDPGSDGLLVVVAPQAMTPPEVIAQKVADCPAIHGKPILASWIGGPLVAPGIDILNRAGIPTFAYPDSAARTFNFMWRYGRDLRALYETPSADPDSPGIDHEQAASILLAARESARTLLTESESKQLLSAYGIPVVRTANARSEDEAVERAGDIGYPVVLKVLSETITHKARVGGVRLGLDNESAVRQAYRDIQTSVARLAGAGHFLGVTVQPMVDLDGYEVIVGSSVDAQFGPVLLFGAGGRLVEVMEDRALGLPPLNTTLAQRLIEQTRISRALDRAPTGEAIDPVALQQLLVRFSRLVVDHRRIKEIDINPLLVSPRGLVALDARVVLESWSVVDDQLPRTAIRPYPSRYIAPWTMRDGVEVMVRPIRPEDEPAMAAFHAALSPETVHMRHFAAIPLETRTRHDALTRACFIDYDRAMALVAERTDPATATREIIGVGRLVKEHGGDEAEFAIAIADRYQGLGLGTELLRRLVQVGKDEGVGRIFGEILVENRPMRKVCSRLGFGFGTPRSGVVRAELAP